MSKQSKKQIKKKQVLEAGVELIPDLYEEGGKPKKSKLQFISFVLGNEWYGVEISKIKDVSALSTITYLPCAPLHIAGIVNLRGNIVSVTDLRKLLGLSPVPTTKESHILVIQAGEFETTIVVDRTPKAMEIELSKIDPPLETLDPSRAEYIVGVCKLKNIFFAILNVEKILAFK
ncbi:MAG TPA: hypothetical protein ENH41_05260 [Candidatus Omnitrophica bacterium]|nr:hypothetical protein [Candidatus Omnitrophota bacterium]